MGCHPIIAIDSFYMSDLYGDALFLATSFNANDANDSTLPLAFGVMNSKNYED